MKRFVSISLLLAAVATVGVTGLVLLKGRAVGTVQIQNGAGDRIEVVTVRVSGNSIEFRNLQPSEKRVEDFRIGSDSHYEISAVFASGKALNGSCGYVTSGIQSNDLITVFDNDIRIGASKLGPAQKCLTK